MLKSSFHPELAEFISSLSRLEEVLEEHEAGYWRAKITSTNQIAEKSDGHCIDIFLGMFGGMGSLNDLVLTAPASVNDTFHEELRRVYGLALELK